MIHVASNGIQQTPAPEEVVRERLARGELKPTDLGWREGMAEWRPLAAMLNLDAPPPPLPPVGFPRAAAATVAAAPRPDATSSGLALTSLICGIAGLLLFLPAIVAIVTGHIARSQIEKSAGALKGAGQAMAGLIMGYIVIGMIPIVGLLAAMAIPAFNKVRVTSIQKMMDNDARMIASASQQYFMENGKTSVDLTYDRATGEIGGPLHDWVRSVAKGYSRFPTRMTSEGTFEIAHPSAGPPHRYDEMGKRLQ